MNKTKIPWADWTWNPIVGCSPASEGCANCYAAAMSKRFHLPWSEAHFMEDRLAQPQEVRKPGHVFVCSMSDMGHETTQPEWRERIYAAMHRARWHQYIILTKRPGAWMREIPVHPVKCWVGVTAETQAHYDDRWFDLTANVQRPGHGALFVSVEPMLGRIDIRDGRPMKPSWVIAGPETGPKKRAFSDSWIDNVHGFQGLHEQCKQEGIPFFDKRDTWTSREFPT